MRIPQRCRDVGGVVCGTMAAAKALVDVLMDQIRRPSTGAQYENAGDPLHDLAQAVAQLVAPVLN